MPASLLRPIPALLGLLLGACVAGSAPAPEAEPIDTRALPAPRATLNIPDLGPCTASPDRSLHIDPQAPLAILVHGCWGSAGEFRALAQVLAFQGQQAACFSYDDRAALADSARALRTALHALEAQGQRGAMTVIGHSQGALIARKAASELRAAPTPAAGFDLVTISGPFAGIRAASPCGIAWLRWVTLGLMPLSCNAVTGAKWADITSTSDFIREPGPLLPGVRRHLKIDTDEAGSCRRSAQGRCVEDDYVFTLAEQRQAAVEEDARVRRLEIRAGHVEIVGDRDRPPLKLLDALQAEGVLRPVPSARRDAWEQMLARAYRSR